MGWAYCGQDRLGRDIGYSIEATCDHTDCSKDIDRGLAFVCGGMHGGDTWGCGMYFCCAHLYMIQVPDGTIVQLCSKCVDEFYNTVLGEDV